MNCAQRCEKLKPDSPDAHFLAGKALFKLGRPAEAIPALARAEKLNPEDGKTHFLLAKIYDHLNEPDLARKERKAFVRIQGPPGHSGMSAVDPVPVMTEDLPKAVRH